MTPRVPLYRDTASVFMSTVEAEGGRFYLDKDGCAHVNCERMRKHPRWTPELCSYLFAMLYADIHALLRSERTVQ
jgi:hypothetical protein